MKKSLYIFAFLILLIVSFLAGHRFNQSGNGPGTVETGARRILHYVDPMNPAHTTSEPGIAPCGMPMEPVYADDDASGGSGAAGSPGLVRVNLQKQQIIGVRTGEVTGSAETSTIRALGRIAADENRIYTLIAATDGWAGEVHESTTGSMVHKDQLMARIKILDYDFFTWQRRYLTDLSNVGRRRSFYAPTSGAGEMSVEIPIGRRAGSPHTETDMPAEMPQAATPEETDESQTPPETKLPHHAAAPATASHPSPPGNMGDMPPIKAPQPSHGSAETHASAPPDAMPQAEEAQTGSPQHSGKTPVLMKKRSTLPEAARRGQARVVVRESDGGLGLSDEEDNFSASRARLELLNLGVGENQLAELSKSRVYITSAELRSPVNGLVLSRNISPRQKIDLGTECFKIADLSRVWVEANVYDSEAKYIRPGLPARITMPNQKEPVAATVSEILPRFDAAARTLKVRLEMDNPELAFRPDMFVDVEFLVPLPESISVPSGAVIDSGKRKTVYVVKEEGIFEPREVTTGWRSSDRVEIVSGLQAGEKIVVSGNFLIDSESRMKLAALKLMEEPAVQPPEQSPEQPVKEQVPAASAAPEPQAAPEPPAAAMKEEVVTGKSKDPICGMTVSHDHAVADGLIVEAEGKTHYFCSAECMEQFKREQKRLPAEKSGEQAPAANPGHGGHAHD